MSTSIMTRTANLLRYLLENLFLPGRTRPIFLWNVFISLRPSWCCATWWSKLSISLCSRLHYYFISNSHVFLQSDITSSRWHPSWELDVSTFQWQVNYWRADWKHQRHVSSLLHRSPPQTLRSPIFFFAKGIFSPFSHNADPDPRLN